ncbi:uncharacterized protein LOC108138057 [Drosophila elegans]|uniref:uncharacterized protein LOC108138057 n=1 Tax=Drosophila elegans TaxID=30023 RepID=UPI0007E78BC0|nr:uncharacterized protein LOC108138057 [Drosophila elegans]
MLPVEPERSQRLVPLSSDLIEDIKAHANEYRTPSGEHLEGDIERRTVMTPTVSMTFFYKSKPKPQKRKGEKEISEELAKAMAKYNEGTKSLHLNDKLTPSSLLTSMETCLDNLADGMRTLQPWMPIQIEQTDQLRKEQSPKSTVTLFNQPSSDLSILPSTAVKSVRNKKSEREFYYGMQMHLVNMLVLPKSRTSLFLNQRKEMSSYLVGYGDHWRHDYTDEDCKRDFKAATFLNGSSMDRHSKNVRRR